MIRIFPYLIYLLLILVGMDISYANEEPPRFGGKVRVAINSDIRSTNPGVRRDGNTDMVLYHVGEALVAFKGDLKPAPMLAETIEISEDRLKYHFKLRRGIKFHNGAEMTSAEVVWSWERLLKKETGYSCRPDFIGEGEKGLKIVDIKATGPYGVTFTLNKPSTIFLHHMASIQCLSAILHPSSVTKGGDWITPIATGPYKLKEWKKGQSVTLERFEDYQSRTEKKDGLTGQKIAYFDKIIFQIVPDKIAAKSAIYAGNMDVVFALPFSASKDALRRAKTRKDIKVQFTDTLDWSTLLLQTDDPLLKNKMLRRAIAHSISQDLIATFTTFGYAKGNPSAVQSLSPYYKNLPNSWPEYNVEKARELAKKAGYKGEEITLQTNQKYIYMYDNAIAIQAMMHAAGFNVKIEVFDWASQLTNFFKGNFQMSSFGYSSRSHPALMYRNIIGHKSQSRSAQWDSKEAIDLIAALETAKDDEEVRSFINKLHLLMSEEIPIIGLYNDHIIDLTTHDIMGYKPWAFGRPRLWGVWRMSPQNNRGGSEK